MKYGKPTVGASAGPMKKDLTKLGDARAANPGKPARPAPSVSTAGPVPTRKPAGSAQSTYGAVKGIMGMAKGGMTKNKVKPASTKNKVGMAKGGMACGKKGKK